MDNQASSLREHQEALIVLLDEFDRVCKILNIPYVLFAGTMLGAVRHKGFIPWDDDLDVLMLRKDYARFLNEADTVIDRKRFYLQKEFSEHWPMFFSKLRLNQTTCLEKYHPKDSNCHQGIYMDIFPCDYAKNSEFGRKMQFWASKVVIAKSLSQRGYETKSIKKKLFIAVCRFLPRKPFWKYVAKEKRTGDMVHTFFSAAKDYSKNVFPYAFITERTSIQFEGKKYPIPVNYHHLLSTMYGDYMVIPSHREREAKKHAIIVDTLRSYEDYEGCRDKMSFDVTSKSIR
ncbi:MAG: LicD family protein [Clostridia bacterium]|nr:LicD family protein [Clostridia bacterium]